MFRGRQRPFWLNYAIPNQAYKDGNQLRVKLPAGLFLQDRQCLFCGIRLLIGAFGNHGVKGIRYAENPSAKGDILSSDAAGISTAVPTLMMSDNCGNYIIQRWQMADDPNGILHMRLHDLVFRWSQSPRFVENVLRNTDFTNIVEQRGFSDHLHMVAVQIACFC